MGFALDTSGSRATIALVIVFPVLSTLSLIGRFYCRRLRKTKLAIDDWLLLLAQVGGSTSDVKGIETYILLDIQLWIRLYDHVWYVSR